MYFRDWKDAHTAAALEAQKLGRDMGLEKWSSPLTPGMKYRVFGPLPKPENRQGFELRCEVIGPTDPL